MAHQGPLRHSGASPFFLVLNEDSPASWRSGLHRKLFVKISHLGDA
jgi:hypothetical protein